ncbi:hypothetical protein OYC64_010884 [Pagothenia borchgrevinki]|uniref:Coiled-coil domain-containing protein 30-like n=1 Tax=Pagothenia borchgrevinki TaxID=8213 RepID=A0ABD2GY07_PAGBO
MDQPQEEMEQIATWLQEEGLAPDSSKEAQLCLLWSALQRTRSHLNSVTWDLDTQHSQHLAEMAEVRKSLEQIRFFTDHKDVLVHEIQDENDLLKDQMQRLVSLQDSQISEVAKMLYQQGLTELIHSSPSEQVAYLLVERASLLETSQGPSNLMGNGNIPSPLGTGTQPLNTSAHQGATRHSQSPWKRLFGLHKAAQSKHTFIPAEARHLAGSLERECSRLERDLEEGSRRLAMAHNEIRRLTDELESAHLTQRVYEPELQAAQQEVEQLRQEVQKLKKYEMVELRKAKELNDRLDLEIRALRTRVRTLDTEKNSLQQTVVSLQSEEEQQQQGKVNQSDELAKVVLLQREVKLLQSALQEPQINQAKELAGSQETKLNQSKEFCRDLQDKLSTQSKCLLEKESEILSLKQQLETSQNELDNLTATVCTKENHLQEQKLGKPKEADSQHSENTDCQVKDDKELQTQQQLQNKENTLLKESLDYQDAVKALLDSRDECETLKKEICDTLKCLDKERSKKHEMKEKHKVRLCQAKQTCDHETMWRDEKIKSLERELFLCSHSVAKEKEFITRITVENEKLLVERRRLLQQLNGEEHKKKDSYLTASLSKCRVDFLEMENKKLGNRILHMTNQLAVLERSLHFAEELKNTSNLRHVLKSIPLQASSVMMPETSDIQGCSDSTQNKQRHVTSPPLGFVCGTRSAEMGYMNLTSPQRHSDYTTLSSSKDLSS